MREDKKLFKFIDEPIEFDTDEDGIETITANVRVELTKNITAEMERMLEQAGYVKQKTCKPHWIYMGNNVSRAICVECGTELDRCYSWETSHFPNYCQNCGAKVMSNDCIKTMPVC